MNRRDSDTTADQTPAPAKKAKRGARAIGVIEFLPTGKVRLVPVAVWIDGHYYDASLYASNPEPFALQPETVYLAEDYGEPTGLFTVTLPRQVNGSWIADGLWKPQLAMDAKLAHDAAKLAASQPPKKASRAVMTGDEDAGPPVLRRQGSSGSSGGSTAGSDASQSQAGGSSSSSSKEGQSAPASPPTAATSPSSGRPTLTRPGDEPEPPTPATATAGKPSSSRDDDPDRPTLKAAPKPAEPASSPSASSSDTTVSTASPSSNDSDPGRPILGRGPQPQPADASQSAAASKPGSKTGAGSKGKLPTPVALTPSAAATPATLARERRSYPAISDAGNFEMRPLLYSMSSADRDSATERLKKVALDELQQYMKRRNLGPLPKNARLMEYDLRSFDLELSSSATLVFTAKIPALDKKTLNGEEFDYFVTLVTRQDINGELQKVFSSVTDSNYLDAVPRLEMVGAVDADANGRGDLLFRQYSDGSISYGLYRVFPYQMQKLFEGGASL